MVSNSHRERGEGGGRGGGDLQGKQSPGGDESGGWRDPLGQGLSPGAAGAGRVAIRTGLWWDHVWLQVKNGLEGWCGRPKSSGQDKQGEGV